MTENPRVVQGFIDIYGDWIERYGIDGFRIDTARHVNPEFWQAFIPAMLSRARSRGIPNFHIFGEVAAEGVDVAQLARHTRVDKLPSVLDFAFANAVNKLVAGSEGTSLLARLYQDDGLYEGGATAAIAPAGVHRQPRFRPTRLDHPRRAPQCDRRRGVETSDAGQRDDVPAARRTGRVLRR
jgi:hypothetical protein